MSSPDPDALDAELAAIFAARDREHMQPTIEKFLAVLQRHPDDAAVLYEVGGAYDTDGQEQVALGYYERARTAGLTDDRLRRWFLQYGSTLRNLGRHDESIAIFDEAIAAYPDSPSLAVFRAISLHAAGRSDQAIGSMIMMIMDRFATDDLTRYEAALRGNAEYLLERDQRHEPDPPD